MTANRRYKIAITGGIGSGKTSFSDILRSLSYTVISADDVYASLLEDNDFVLKCSEILGLQPIKSGDRLVFDRASARKIVFSDTEKRNKLNDFTHSLVYKKMFEEWESSNEKITFFEVPLLFESKGEGLFDSVVVVMRDVSERINSIMARDDVDEQTAIKKISSQVDYNNLPLDRHTIIVNDKSIFDLRSKAENLISYYTKTLI